MPIHALAGTIFVQTPVVQVRLDLILAVESSPPPQYGIIGHRTAACLFYHPALVWPVRAGLQNNNNARYMNNHFDNVSQHFPSHASLPVVFGDNIRQSCQLQPA